VDVSGDAVNDCINQQVWSLLANDISDEAKQPLVARDTKRGARRSAVTNGEFIPFDSIVLNHDTRWWDTQLDDFVAETTAHGHHVCRSKKASSNLTTQRWAISQVIHVAADHDRNEWNVQVAREARGNRDIRVREYSDDCVGGWRSAHTEHVRTLRGVQAAGVHLGR
jgi:hypothetical protein